MNVVAFSGGKDSTALALRMAELGEDFVLLFTPTGNELPDLHAHLRRIVALTGRPLVRPANRALSSWIRHFRALPNFRMRWCTRLIKIEPCVRFLEDVAERDARWYEQDCCDLPTLIVGLRADEPEREGLYGDHATYRYPLREWGWGLAEVWGYLGQRGIDVPRRTDCALCYGQRLSEWWTLWRDHPTEYAKGERWEDATGFTFRSRGRDSWPAALRDLRAEFEKGRRPRGADDEDALFDNGGRCRVCVA